MSEADLGHPVRWQRLELYGFGRHEALAAGFGSGLTTLVAPNEFGKSTMIAGLAATVFGLPHLSDATKFGRERYRNWQNPSRFEGVVTFLARDGRSYTLQRNFESHDVRIVRHAAAGAEEIFQDHHNPNARTGTAAFEEHLERLIGMTDREAFQQSFHVGQPLPPPERLGEEVQRLLSGSGQGTFRTGLEWLAAQITERTSATGDLGVTARNLRKNRRLEEVKERIAETSRRLHEGREAADRTKEVGEKLQRLHSEKVRLENEERRLDALSQAYKSWLDAKDAHGRAARDHRSLKDALQRGREQARQIEAAQAGLEQDWPEFREADPQLERKLEVARDARRDVTRAEEELAAAREALGRAQEAAAEAEAAQAAHEATEPQRDSTYDAEELRELEGEAARAVQDWERFRKRERDIAAREGALEPFRSLEAADEQLLELLRNYRFELDRRQRDVEEAQRAATPTPVPAPAPTSGPEPTGLGRRAAIGLVAALALAGLVYAVSESATLALVAALLGGGVAAFLAPRLALGLAPTREDRSVSDRAAGKAPDEYRGGTGPSVSGAADAPPPTGVPGAAHEGEQITAQHALDTFMEATRPFVESFDAFEDPGSAVRSWDEARRELGHERRMQAEHADRVWGVEPDQVEALVPTALAGSWGNLARYAQTRGGSHDTLAGLGKWLAEQDDATWRDAIERAAAAAAAHARWQEEKQEKDRKAVEAAALREQAEEARKKASNQLDRTREAEAAARAEIEHILEHADRTAGELLDRWKAFQQARADLVGRKNTLVAMLKGRDADSLEELADREYAAGMDVLKIANHVDEVREEHPELPPLDADREAVAERWRELERTRKGVSGELEGVATDIFEQETARSRLAGKDLVNIAQVEIELQELGVEREDLEREIDALAIAHRELQAAVTEFQANYRERLERAASDHIQRFSDTKTRRVALGEDFAVTVVEPNGAMAHPSQLSQGTQDQLLLALRLAIADHLSDDAPLPLILDDPFLNWDASRLEQVEDALRQLGEARQVILLSHREDFGSWGEPIELG